MDIDLLYRNDILKRITNLISRDGYGIDIQIKLSIVICLHLANFIAYFPSSNPQTQ